MTKNKIEGDFAREIRVQKAESGHQKAEEILNHEIHETHEIVFQDGAPVFGLAMLEVGGLEMGRLGPSGRAPPGSDE